jgi:hypothetical protein
MGRGLTMLSAPWRIALTSEIGTSHAASGTPCQDSAGHAILETSHGPILVAAVSDGAGSATHSHIGSAQAVATFIAEVTLFLNAERDISTIDADQALRWIRTAADAVTAKAQSNNHEPRNYSCTLLAAIVGADHAAFIQIGDGAIVVSHGDEDGWSYVFWPQHGEFANTTNFIQSPELENIIAFDLAPRRIDEFAIFSDGIENLVLHKASRSVQQSFFQSMIQPVRKIEVGGLAEELSEGLRRYLASPTICERTDDDKTLVLATRSALIESSDARATA